MTITNNRLPNSWRVVTDKQTTDAIVGKTFELVDEPLVRVHLYHDDGEWHVEAQFRDEEDAYLSTSYGRAAQAKREARRLMRGLERYDDRVAGYHRADEE